MQLIAAIGLIPLFAYMNAATGSTLPSPCRINGNWYWWSHWTTAIVQGLSIYTLTHSIVLTLAFSVGWYVWRKIEFGFLLDRTAPQTTIGRWIDDCIVDSERGRWIVRWFAPAWCVGFLLILFSHRLVGVAIMAAGYATALLYINRNRMTPSLRECAAGALWGVCGSLSAIL